MKNRFKRWLSQQNLSEGWMQELVSRLKKMGLFSNAFTGKNLKTLLRNALKHKLSNNKVKALRKFIRFCVEKGYLLENEAEMFLKQLKTKPTLPDTKVPKDEEIKQVILELKSKWLKSYLILLFPTSDFQHTSI